MPRREAPDSRRCHPAAHADSYDVSDFVEISDVRCSQPPCATRSQPRPASHALLCFAAKLRAHECNPVPCTLSDDCGVCIVCHQWDYHCRFRRYHMSDRYAHVRAKSCSLTLQSLPSPLANNVLSPQISTASAASTLSTLTLCISAITVRPPAQLLCPPAMLET